MQENGWIVQENGWIIHWYAIQVRPRSEIATAKALSGKGFEPLVPLYKSRRNWSDRKVNLDLPLFPGYIFCRFDARTRLPIMTTPNVVRIVGNGKMPLPIDAHEIEAVERVLQSGYGIQPHPFVAVGSRVMINDGPLAGLEGIVKSLKNRRLVLSVGMVQQSICVDLKDDDFTIIKSTLPSYPAIAGMASVQA